MGREINPGQGLKMNLIKLTWAFRLICIPHFLGLICLGIWEIFLKKWDSFLNSGRLKLFPFEMAFLAVSHFPICTKILENVL